MLNYLVLDLETGCKELYKRKGNPWYNDIVAIGIKIQNMEAFTQYFPSPVHPATIESYLQHIKGASILIGHNIKFDLLYLWKYGYLRRWLSNGGTIWDTQLAEYILTGQQSKYTSLRELAVSKYGCKEREKLMEKYWEQGTYKILDSEGYILHDAPLIQTAAKVTEMYVMKDRFKGTKIVKGAIDTKDIPKELVLEDVKNDVLDTEQVYSQQLKLAGEQGQTKLIELQMDALLATTEMEYNGMKVDLKVLRSNRDALQEELCTVTTKLDGLISTYWKYE